MMNIVNVKTSVFATMPFTRPLTNLQRTTVIASENRECATPNVRSYQPSVDNSRFEMNTPRTIPIRYFLLNTTRWLNISDTRNWIFVKPNGAMSAVTARYNAAMTALTAIVLTFIYFLSPSFVFAGWLRTAREKSPKFNLITGFSSGQRERVEVVWSGGGWFLLVGSGSLF